MKDLNIMLKKFPNISIIDFCYFGKMFHYEIMDKHEKLFTDKYKYFIRTIIYAEAWHFIEHWEDYHPYEFNHLSVEWLDDVDKVAEILNKNKKIKSLTLDTDNEDGLLDKINLMKIKGLGIHKYVLSNYKKTIKVRELFLKDI